MDFATPRVFATARNDPDEIDDTTERSLGSKPMNPVTTHTAAKSVCKPERGERVEVKRARCRSRSDFGHLITSYYFYYLFITYQQCRLIGNEVTVSSRRQCRRQSLPLI